MKRLAYLIICSIVIVAVGLGLFLNAGPVKAQVGIPAGATITSATFSIYVTGINSTNLPTVNIHRITAAWTETGVTWNNFNHSYDSTVVASFAPTTEGWYSANITSLAQAWFDGTFPNYGILLEQGQLPYSTYNSSEFSDVTLRPKLEICYTAAGMENTCVTIQRPGTTPDDVIDTYIWASIPDGNNAANPILYTGLLSNREKQSLIRFDFMVTTPDISIIKYTNGQIAADPNGTDVPLVIPGAQVTWTYQVTNTGNVSVPRASVIVTDDQPGVTPAFDQEVSGNGDTIFNPGEVWLYSATGVAADLLIPPAGMIVVHNACTVNGTQLPRTAYVNHGTASIPGASKTAPSSYCNPAIPSVAIVKYTNGNVAADPNGTDVPQVIPGDPVVWLYKITNTGNVSVPKDNVVVTDDQPGVNPVYDQELSGNGDNMFDPNEVWLYKATGMAADLNTPPAGMIIVPSACTANGSQPSRNAYVNHGIVTIPGASQTAPSSYCNPPGNHLYHVYIPGVAKNITANWQTSVGFEDLPLLYGANDYDFNDWAVDINGNVALNPINNILSKITFDFNPIARGAGFTHAFHLRIPAQTFHSDGTAVLTTYDANHNVSGTQTLPFTASSINDYVIFNNTLDVFPGSLVDTIEGQPFVYPQRFAKLSITFNSPFEFSFASYNFSDPHGVGMFFDPYLKVWNTGDEIHTGDLRLLIVPSTGYLYPEERVRIDHAYPLVTYVPGNPVNFLFPNGWWTSFNHCVYDGVPCTAP